VNTGREWRGWVVGAWAISMSACGVQAPAGPHADPAPAAAPTAGVIATAPQALSSRASSSTPEQALHQIEARLARPDLRTATSLRPDGGRSIALNGTLQHAMIAVRGPDGRMRTTCVDTAQAAARVLGVQAPTKAP
jgi:hypothetical protein